MVRLKNGKLLEDSEESLSHCSQPSRKFPHAPANERAVCVWALRGRPSNNGCKISDATVKLGPPLIGPPSPILPVEWAPPPGPILPVRWAGGGGYMLLVRCNGSTYHNRETEDRC